MHFFIHFGGFVVIAFEAHIGKLRTAAQAWLHIGHAYRLAHQIGAQIQAELLHIGFGRAIHIAARIRICTCHRAQINHMATTARIHARQHLAGKIGQADDVGVYHGQPIGEIGFVSSFQTQGQACVVHQHIDVLPLGRQVLQCAVYVF